LLEYINYGTPGSSDPSSDTDLFKNASKFYWCYF